MRMNIETLREFQVIAMTQNISKAARELHVTQSCLSKHMAELESETKLELLKHDAKKISLAPAGKLFARQTASILAAWDDCLLKCKALQDAAQNGPGKLSVAMFLDGNTANTRLFLSNREYRAAHPDIEVSFAKLIGHSPLEALDSGEFDAVVDLVCGSLEDHFPKEYHDRLIAVALESSPLVVWFRRDNRLGSRDRIVLEDLEHANIMTSVTNVYDYIRQATRDAFSMAGMVPYFMPVHFDEDSPSSYFMTDFDAHSIMFTTEGMVSDSIFGFREDIVYRIPDDPRLKATSYLLALKDNEPAKDFCEFVQNANKGYKS